MNLELDNWCGLPTAMGEFRMYDVSDESVHVVCMGAIEFLGRKPLLRVHSSCLASEVFGATDCDCADQLREAMNLISTEGRGLIVHLYQEGRGQGLSRKIKAVQVMQREGYDTFQAFDALGLEQDIRRYDPVVLLLRLLGIQSVRLISNNPAKQHYLQAHGFHVEMVSTHPMIRPENEMYLKSKNTKLGHQLPIENDKNSDGTIRFYHSDRPWGGFSNFSRHAVFLRGQIWSTVEHFYQAQKFADTALQDSVRSCPTPALAKQRATELSIKYLRQDWHTIKEQVMLEGLRAKFGQHPDLREQLLLSGHRAIVEHTTHDNYWGDAGDGTGQNRLGMLLINIRSELQTDREKSEQRNRGVSGVRNRLSLRSTS